MTIGTGVPSARMPAPSSGTLIGVADSANVTVTLPAIDPAALGVNCTCNAHVLFGLRVPRQPADREKSEGVAEIAVIVSGTEPRLVSNSVRSMLGSPTVW